MLRTNLVLSLALAAFTGCAGNGMGGDDGDGGGGSGSRPGMDTAVSTLAGYSNPGYQDGNRQVNLFNNPTGLAFNDGKLYVADFDNSKLRVIDMEGNATTLIAKQNFSRPFGLVFVGSTLYAATDRDGQGQHDPVGSTDQMTGTVWRIDIGARTATVVAEKIGRPRSMAALTDGRIAIADKAHHVIQILDPASGTVTPLAGTWNITGSADGVGASATFNEPYGIVQRSDGKLVVADALNHKIRLVGLDGTVSTLAGSTSGYADGAGAAAKFNEPRALAKVGNDIYITEVSGYRVRKLSGDTVTTVAGDGTPGYKDDDNKGAAQFYGLEGIAVNGDGSRIFVSDGTGGEDVPYNRIRVIKN